MQSVDFLKPGDYFKGTTIHYRERKIRRITLATNPMQEQVRCCQIWGRRRKVGESHE